METSSCRCVCFLLNHHRSKLSPQLDLRRQCAPPSDRRRPAVLIMELRARLPFGTVVAQRTLTRFTLTLPPTTVREQSDRQSRRRRRRRRRELLRVHRRRSAQHRSEDGGVAEDTARGRYKGDGTELERGEAVRRLRRSVRSGGMLFRNGTLLNRLWSSCSVLAARESTDPRYPHAFKKLCPHPHADTSEA